jgi:hypothetical protein
VPYFSFLEDKVHAKEVLVEKLALKNTTYRTAIQKLEAQLAHKEEMGEVGGFVMCNLQSIVCNLQIIVCNMQSVAAISC